MPDEPEVLGLLALLLLTESPRPARFASDGPLVLLADQDRARWVRPLIDEGRRAVRAGLPAARRARSVPDPSRHQRRDPAATDRSQIVQLYDQLLACAPTPVVALNRAVALAEMKGPASRSTPSPISSSTAMRRTTWCAPSCWPGSGAWTRPPTRATEPDR